ncbi:hypothetical protein [Comamonas testosteroni]|uniref:hypothetical protein n=1 Tax=Comamonas testosteroni TaxID=285 RepID=UPI0026F082E5|nr:hypothetical protein [Comamonas testosteroni]
MNYLAACMDCRRSTAALVGRDDCLLFFEVGKTSADQLADHAGNAAAAAASDNDFSHLAVVFCALFSETEIDQIVRLRRSLLGYDWGLMGAHVSSILVKKCAASPPRRQLEQWTAFAGAVMEIC